MSLARIAAALRADEGLEVEAVGARHLGDAVGRLRAQAGVDEHAFAELVTADAEVRERLIGELLVHETSFFRYPASFSHLAAHVVAAAAARPGCVRVLSAACATGQEAYSIAITMLEAGLPPERVAVDAFDRSHSAIRTARTGIYGPGGARGLGTERAARWFACEGDERSILPQVRGLVRFEVASCLDDDRPFAPRAYDAIFCRNLLIYLTEAARPRVLEALRASLVPGGVLYLGHAEVLVARAEGFQPLSGAGVYACVVKPTTAQPPAPTVARTPSRRNDPPARTQVPPAAPVHDAPVVVSGADVLCDARALADAGRLPEACALLEADVARGRSDADHFHLLALVRRAAGNSLGADDALGRALYLDPSHVGALQLASVAAEGRGERSIAARLAARARAAAAGKP